MSPNRTKKQNLEIIQTRLNLKTLPSRFKNLSATVIAIFADSPALDPAVEVIITQNDIISFAIKKAEQKYEQSKQSGDLREVLKAGQAMIKSLKLKYQ